MDARRNIIIINDITKWLLMEDIRLITDFICDFTGDEEDFRKLIQQLNKNSFGIPCEINTTINSFVSHELEPMVYEFETVFPFYQFLKRNENGVISFDSKDEFYPIAMEFYKILYEKEKNGMNLLNVT